MKFLFAFCLGLLSGVFAYAQGTETFSNMPASNSSYLSRTWTGDGGITWTATDARTDQSINGRAIGIRNSTLSSGTNPNGIATLSFQYKYLFTTGGAATLVVRINGTDIGTVSVPMTQTAPATATFTGLAVSGAFTIEIAQTTTGARVAIDDVIWTANTSSCTPPATQATTAVFSNPTSTTLQLGWTAPTGTNSLVVVRQGSAVTATPSSGTAYTASATFGGGTALATGQFVAFNGSGNSVTLTGLTTGTTYHVAVYSFDAATLCYNTVAPATASASTACSEPTTQPSSFTATTTSTSATLQWSGGDGGAYLVKLNTTNSFTPPADGTAYTPSTTYAGGEQTVFSGAGSSVTVGGLTASSTYYAVVYAYNACSGSPDYLVAGAPTQSFATGTNNVPAGYYASADGLTCAALKTALSTITTNGHTQNNYGGLDNIEFLTTDDRTDDAGNAPRVWDMYSDNPTGPDPYTYTFSQFNTGGAGEGDGWNKEHSFPNSWFSPSSSTNNFPGADLHHIYPTDVDVNSLRSNHPFGKVASATTTTLNGSKLGSSALAFSTNTGAYSGPVFEPIDAYKGDFARATLYMVTRYQSSVPTWETYQTGGDVVMDNSTYPSIELEYLKMLLQWHQADPVSPKEIERNNEVYGYQGNRNPFIDRPEYVSSVWSSGCGLALPVTLSTFVATYTNGAAQLRWTAENASGFSHFEVERSRDGSRFVRIGRVDWQSGVSSYTFADPVSADGATYYYRLRLVDVNRVFTFSPVARINTTATSGFNVFPNPARGEVFVDVPLSMRSGLRLVFRDAVGKTVLEQSFPLSNARISLSTAQLPAGQYRLELASGEKRNSTWVIVQR